MAAEHDLGAMARQRMDALLPELLGTLRARVRRARRRRMLAALVLVAIPAVSWPLLGSPSGTPSSAPPGTPTVPAAAVANVGWSEVHDDAGVLARCEVVAVARASWFAGDAELQGLLREADKPAGLVRAGERVFVRADAIDPWPALAP